MDSRDILTQEALITTEHSVPRTKSVWSDNEIWKALLLDPAHQDILPADWFLYVHGQTNIIIHLCLFLHLFFNSA